jgi:hypothetical protein
MDCLASLIVFVEAMRFYSQNVASLQYSTVQYIQLIQTHSTTDASINNLIFVLSCFAKLHSYL